MPGKLRLKTVVFALAALCLGVSAAAGLAEVLVRALSLSPGLNRVATNIHRLSNNPALRYELVPYSYHSYEAINGDGRRDFHYPPAKSTGAFRIAVLGDSVTYGWGTNVWYAHPNTAEYYLNRFQKTKTHTFEFFNFGVRGYGVDEMVEFLRSKALKIDPDLVIVAYNLNDPDPFSVDLAWVLSRMQWKDERYLGEMRKALGRRFTGALYQHSHLFRLIRYRLLARQQQAQRKKAKNAEGETLIDQEKQYSYNSQQERYFFEIAQAYWPRVQKAFAQIGQIASERGVPVALVVLPALDDLADYRYGPLHEQVVSEAEKNGLLVFDLLPDFQDAAVRWPSESLAIDFNHPNALGQRLAGWAIAMNLLAAGLLPVDREQMQPAFFEPNLSLQPADLSCYVERDMYHIEEGLASLFFEDPNQAVNAFGKALHLNPENRLATKLLREVYGQTDDPKLKHRIRQLLR